jgi:hypothetical protein
MAQAGNRGYWEVENREHYVRDRTFDEDRSQVRTSSSPQFLAHRPQHRDEPAAAQRVGNRGPG